MNSNDLEVQFQPVGKRVNVPTGTSLLDAARKAGIPLASTCGGERHCGQCRVIVLGGQVSLLTREERFILSQNDLLNSVRLACCTSILGDIKVELPKDSLLLGQKLQVQSDLGHIDPDPEVFSYPLELIPPSLGDTRSDLSRIIDGLKDQYGLHDLFAGQNTINFIPTYLRENQWRISAFLRSNEIIGLGTYTDHLYGYAVDLGTTKIAAYLMDLETGREIDGTGEPNPQIGYGEDVISRLNYINRNPSGRRVLAEKARETLDELLNTLTKRCNVRRGQVVEGCIVGNPAMIHLLLEFPVHQLATAPYVAATDLEIDIPADRLGITMAPGANIYIPPSVGGFVGADHVAMILATGLDVSTKTMIGIDIGTNTEIVIRKPGLPFFLSVSCASGPAFEGAHIYIGSFLNIKNAIAINFLPDLPKANYRQVGNAAGVGAKWILISKSARERARRIAENARYHELTTSPNFGRKFALGMLFPRT